MHELIANSDAILASTAMDTLNQVMDSITNFFNMFGMLGKVILALIIFILLKSIAGKLKGVLQKLFDKTSLDDKLAAKLGYKSDVSKAICTIAHLVMIIYAAVIALNVAELDSASTPLQNMLNDLLGYVPRIIGAGILLYILLFVANVVKQLLANVMEVAKIDERVGSATGTPVANSLVAAAYGFLILLFLPAVLDLLSIEAISEPIKGIVSSITAAVPKILLAGVLIAVGLLVGQVASRVVSNLLHGTGVDQFPGKIGIAVPSEGKGSISSVVGLVVLITIVLSVFAAAISSLQIPLLAGLSEVLLYGYKNLLIAAIVLVGGIIGSKFAFDALADKNLLMAKIAKAVVLVVSSVVALDRAGVASDLTSLPYKVTIIAAGVAFGVGGAIAIGLGAREYISRLLDKKGGL